MINTPSRGFFGKKNNTKSPEEERKTAAEDVKEEAKTGPNADAGAKDTKTKEKEKADNPTEEGKDAAKKSKSSSSESSTSASEEEVEEGGLSAKDVKRIKKLFSEQEAEIKSLEKRIEELDAETKRKDKEIFIARSEYTKQVKENEMTVLRYRKMIEDEKDFAITKFAKDLLEVRDALRMATEHQNIESVENEADIAKLKERFIQAVHGQ